MMQFCLANWILLFCREKKSLALAFRVHVGEMLLQLQFPWGVFFVKPFPDAQMMMMMMSSIYERIWRLGWRMQKSKDRLENAQHMHYYSATLMNFCSEISVKCGSCISSSFLSFI
jgi:hypothetical protein